MATLVLWLPEGIKAGKYAIWEPQVKQSKNGSIQKYTTSALSQRKQDKYKRVSLATALTSG